METFKDFFACKIVLVAKHHYPKNIQRLFRLQNCLKSKWSISWKYSKVFSPANLSYPQIIIILKIFKDFFASKIVLLANHLYPESFQILFACKIVLAANHDYPENIQRLIRLQNCLSWKPSLSWKYSKTLSPAKLSSTQIIIILKIFKDFFACKIVLAAKLRYPEKIQRLFRLQNCLKSKWSLSWKYSKTLSPANLSYPQIINILKVFKGFFASKIALAANHHYPENIERLIRLQNYPSRKSPLSWKHSKTFSLAKLSEPQNIIILKMFKDFLPAKLS